MYSFTGGRSDCSETEEARIGSGVIRRGENTPVKWISLHSSIREQNYLNLYTFCLSWVWLKRKKMLYRFQNVRARVQHLTPGFFVTNEETVQILKNNFFFFTLWYNLAETCTWP